MKTQYFKCNLNWNCFQQFLDLSFCFNFLFIVYSELYAQVLVSFEEIYIERCKVLHNKQFAVAGNTNTASKVQEAVEAQ